MTNIIPLIAKKYNRKGDTSGTLKSLVDDLVFIGDVNDSLLFITNIPRETKYSIDIITSNDKYSEVLNNVLSSLNIDLDYHKLLLNAIDSESYKIISLISDNIPTPDLFLSKNNYGCLTTALGKSYTWYGY